MRLSSFERSIFSDRALVEIIVTQALSGREILIGRSMLGEQTEEDMIGEESQAIRDTIKHEGAAAFTVIRCKAGLNSGK